MIQTSKSASAVTYPLLRLPHLELLLTLILVLVIQSFLPSVSLVSRSVFNLLLLAVVLAAIRTLSASRKRLAIAVALGTVSYVLSWFDEFRHETMLTAAMLTGYTVVFSILVVALSENVFGDGLVDGNRVIGAACIYFVLGLVWALVYSLLETLQPGSFRFADPTAADGLVQDKVSELIYFSNVTLTTLGYGDVVPVSHPAKMLASLEAIVGQLYVAIVIARIVGLHISQDR